MEKFLVLAGALLVVLPAAAAESPWQSIAPDVRVRLIASEAVGPDGTTHAALELDMPASTKTYWRVPGETGIPTEIDLDGSAGVSGARIVWPYPRAETRDGYVDFVYYGPTVLPIELTAEGGAAALQASVVMGICSDICVPAQAEFTLPLDFAAPDRGQSVRIDQAIARAPLPWDAASEPIGELTLDQRQEALVVPLADPRVDPLSVIADAGDGGPLFGTPQKSRDGKLVLLPLLAGSAAEHVGRQVHLTFMTPDGPYELSRIIARSTPDDL